MRGWRVSRASGRRTDVVIIYGLRATSIGKRCAREVCHAARNDELQGEPAADTLRAGNGSHITIASRRNAKVLEPGAVGSGAGAGECALRRPSDFYRQRNFFLMLLFLVDTKFNRTPLSSNCNSCCCYFAFAAPLPFISCSLPSAPLHSGPTMSESCSHDASPSVSRGLHSFNLPPCFVSGRILASIACGRPF